MGVYRRYQWNFRGVNFQYEITWPQDIVDVLKEERHDITKTSEYGWYVRNDPFQDVLIQFLDEIIDLGRKNLDLSRNKDLLHYLLSFVQHFRYYKDRGGEYPRYPSETVVDRGGDCEDSAILMAFIAIKLGYRCAFLGFRNEGFLGIGRWAHVDLGIAPSSDGEFDGSYWTGDDGTEYFYASCNGAHWKIGQFNGRFGDKARVYPV